MTIKQAPKYPATIIPIIKISFSKTKKNKKFYTFSYAHLYIHREIILIKSNFTKLLNINPIEEIIVTT